MKYFLNILVCLLVQKFNSIDILAQNSDLYLSTQNLYACKIFDPTDVLEISIHDTVFNTNLLNETDIYQAYVDYGIFVNYNL